MTRITEQRRFARFYKLQLAVVQELWTRYAHAPIGYKEVLAVDSDAKTSKGRKLGYLTGICYFAPGSLSGYNVCRSASEACLKACLAFQGRARMKSSGITEARIRKTLRYFEDTDAFLASFLHDAFRLMRTACKLRLIPCVRPNGTSDLPKLAWYVADALPMLQVYDYTKHPKPYLRTRSNYSLTFSYSGGNYAECMDALKNGVNVTVVFNKAKPLPATYWGYRVVDGDESDLRFLDPKGVIVGLKSKGNSATLETSNSFIILQ